MKRKVALILSVIMLCTANQAFADVLGTFLNGWTTDMGADTYLHGTTFVSEQNGIGNQSEYYVEYVPNENAIPVVINGDSLWGTRTITQAMSYMSSNGLRPLIGINADYFSYKTGMPMGTSIMNGEITTSLQGYIDAVGFRKDGTGFIRGLNLKTTVYHGENSANIECINKWYTKDYTPIGIITDKFGKTTKTTSECLFLVCKPTDGTLSIGKTLTLEVEDKFEYSGDVAIPDGRIILLINKTGYETDYNFLNNITVGETITITNTALDDSEGIWGSAYNAIGTSAGRLLKNGEVGSGFEAGVAPRTAVGIKEDGTVIFYVIDGRQSGHSYGVQNTTLAKRLKELGCVDALNLDGGGSTAMAGIFPGSDRVSVVNSPSDGRPRSCANYLFLKDNRKPTGIPGYVVTDNVKNKNFMSGTSTKFSIVELYDSANYKMDSIEKINVELVNEENSESYIDADNVIHFEGTGKAIVNVKSEKGVIYKETYEVYNEPEDMKFYNQNTWKEVNEIYCAPMEDYSIDIAASPLINGFEVNTQDNLYEWSVVGDIGTVNENGVFVLSHGKDKAGKIVVKKGNFKKEINVYIEGYDSETETSFADISGHWAQNTILIMAENGTLNGYEENSKKYFKPDAFMTRAEFAKMICVFAGYDAEDYSNLPLSFADSDEIPLWAHNYVKAMSENKIMQGKVDNGKYYFEPFANITRAEAMTVMGRLLEGVETSRLEFADANDIPEWAHESMGKLLSAGIIQGYNDNTILPNNNIKRAEAAVMLYKTES